ncbi:HYC_CC_PP family protein [Gangjinia marincola]|uniref:HYC_CC_PP family protein n=1 Tax=Gangjinia marincola TaxID=578463 RepID=UPI0031E2DD46
MKKVAQHITAGLLALLVLFSSVSFTVDMHYCGGHLVDLAINHEAESCSMEQLFDHPSEGLQALMSSCCKDKQITMIGEDHEVPSFSAEKDLDVPVHAITHSYLYDATMIRLDQVIPFNAEYPPPLPQRPLFILYESYLI